MTETEFNSLSRHVRAEFQRLAEFHGRRVFKDACARRFTYWLRVLNNHTAEFDVWISDMIDRAEKPQTAKQLLALALEVSRRFAGLHHDQLPLEIGGRP